MEGIELRKAIEEARSLVGARLSKVHQIGDVFFLRFYRPTGALALDLGGKAFHRTALRPRTPPSPPPFCMLLRSLAGQPLLSLDQAGLDRVLRLRFPEADLVLDLRPRHGDLFFLARAGRTTSFRGRTLQTVDFAAPDDPWAGIGPGLRRAAAAQLGHPASPEELAAFAAQLLSLPPTGYLYAASSVASFFPRPELGDPSATFPSFAQALDCLLERRLEAGVARDQLADIGRALARRERALAALTAAEAEARLWPQIQAHADLILTRSRDIPRGASAAVVEGFDGQPVTLSLDPALPPLAQARALYAKAKKLRRRLEAIPDRRRELEEEIGRLRQMQELLSRQPDLAPYLEGEARTLAPGPDKGKAPTKPTPRQVVVGGFTILVGRSGRENDRLVRLASPDDLWLHARGVPGAHVLVRTEGRSVPSEVLKRAAEIAAWHSRARGERKVEVSYTDARYVRKPKGAPPGMVKLLREQVLVVQGDQGP